MIIPHTKRSGVGVTWQIGSTMPRLIVGHAQSAPEIAGYTGPIMSGFFSDCALEIREKVRF